MVKRIIFALTGLVISISASAKDIGIGLSAREGDTSIYIPVNINSEIRTEYFIRHTGMKYEGTEISGMKQESESTEAGVGVYKLFNQMDKTTLYSGIRLSYLKSNIEYTQSSSTSKHKNKGYSIMPLVGIEYFISDSLSVGGEAGVYFSKINGDNDGLNPSDTESTTYGTTSKLMVRFYFKS